MPTLLDTGILLRVFAQTDPLYRETRQALLKLRREGEELLTSFQNVAEFVNVSTRPASARGGYGLSLKFGRQASAIRGTSLSRRDRESAEL